MAGNARPRAGCTVRNRRMMKFQRTYSGLARFVPAPNCSPCPEITALSGHHCWAISAGILILSDHGKWRSALAMQTAKLVMAGLVALLGVAHAAVGADTTVSGLWQKTDQQTGNPVVWFYFFENEGTYRGIIAKSFPRPGDPPNPTCASCRDDRKDQPLLGLSLIRDMKPGGQAYNGGVAYEGGNILD